VIVLQSNGSIRNRTFLLVLLFLFVAIRLIGIAVAATFNNIGPGFAKVGPTCNFAFFNPLSKIVLTFDMLAGRLEIFPMLLLFFPSTWRR
jgi:Trk-type K+ transport system membrane component